MQSYPDLQPLYDAARSYLEIPQRIHLLNTRAEVIVEIGRDCPLNTDASRQVLQDMLQLLKETVSSQHSERLEQIVIALIAMEICAFCIALVNSTFSLQIYDDVSTRHRDYTGRLDGLKSTATSM